MVLFGPSSSHKMNLVWGNDRGILHRSASDLLSLTGVEHVVSFSALALCLDKMIDLIHPSSKVGLRPTFSDGKESIHMSVEHL